MDNLKKYQKESAKTDLGRQKYGYFIVYVYFLFSVLETYTFVFY